MANSLHIILFTGILLMVASLGAADQVDSLRMELLRAKKPAEIIDLQNSLSEELRRTEPQVARSLAQQSLILSKQIDDSLRQAESCQKIGLVYSSLLQSDSAFKYLNTALSLIGREKQVEAVGDILEDISYVWFRQNNYRNAANAYFEASEAFSRSGQATRQGECLNNAGLAYWNLGEFELALNYYQHALAIFKDAGNLYWQGLVNNNIGTIYWGLGIYNTALEYYHQAILFRHKTNDIKGEILTLNNIGLIYQEWKKIDQAFAYHRKGIVLSDSTNNIFGIAYSQINLGNCFFHKQQYDTALYYYQKSRQNYRLDNKKIGESLSLKHMGDVYQIRHQFDRAMEHYQYSYALADSIQNHYRICIALNSMAIVYFKQQHYQTALTKAKESLVIAEDQDYRDLKEKNYALLADIYEATGNFALALQNYRSASVWQDSLFNKEKMNQFADLQVRLNLERKDKENEILKRDNKIQQLQVERISFIRNSLLVIIFLAVMLLIALYLRYRAKHQAIQILQQQNDEVNRVNREKEKLIIDLREALNNVKTLSGLLPICASCKKVRDDDGYWSSVETYITRHSDAVFSHGLCPDCFTHYSRDIGKTG